MNIPLIPLGKSEVKVPPIGIGCWSWGDTLVWGYGKGYGEPEIHLAFNACIRAGANFFDTAEVYGFGKSESFLGKFLQGDRKRAIVATKFFPWPYRLTKGGLTRALRGSLRRLGLPQVDLYQVHQPIPPVAVETWMDAMADAVEAGLTRAVGVSNYNVDKTRAAEKALARRGIPLASNQISYSLLNRKPERSGLISLCRDLQVTVIAYSPIAMGMLTGKYTPANPPPGARSRRYPPDYLARVQPLIALMREIGKGHGNRTPTQVALNWVICKGAIPIPGPKNESQAADILGSLGWELSKEEVAALDKASDGLS
jgi:aryl-alcohol dehydrogenase-like predicted oxidoreductase